MSHGRDSLREPAHWTSGWLGWVQFPGCRVVTEGGGEFWGQTDGGGTRAVRRHKDFELGGKEHCLLQEMLPHEAGCVLPVERGSQMKVGKHIKICLGPQKKLPNVQL